MTILSLAWSILNSMEWVNSHENYIQGITRVFLISYKTMNLLLTSDHISLCDYVTFIVFQTTKHSQQGRLARSIGSDQADAVTVIDNQTES